MEATVEEKELYGNDLEILERHADRTVYRICRGEGDGIKTSFQVFPGIELIYNNYSISNCFQNVDPIDDIMEINHCKQGRFESEFCGGSNVDIGIAVLLSCATAKERR